MVRSNSHFKHLAKGSLATKTPFLTHLLRFLGIRALRTKVEAFKGSFKAFLDSLDAEVFVFQETKVGSTLKDLEESLLYVEGYESFYSLCTKKAGYSGVATYVKKGMTIDAKSEFGEPSFDCEGRVMMTDHGSFLLFNVYFPNSGFGAERLEYKMEFYRWFERILDSYLEKGRKIIIAGDVNTTHHEVDIWCPEKLRDGLFSTERKWMDRFLGDRDGKEPFVDTFRKLYPTAAKYTWWDVKSNMRITDQGYRLDYLLVNEKFLGEVVNSEMMTEQLGSDHCPVYITLKPQATPTVTKFAALSSERIKARQPRINAFFTKAKKTVELPGSEASSSSSITVASSVTIVTTVEAPAPEASSSQLSKDGNTQTSKISDVSELSAAPDAELDQKRVKERRELESSDIDVPTAKRAKLAEELS